MSEISRAQTEQSEGSTTGRTTKEAEASLWADAWRSLRSNPWFIVSGAILVVMIVMALFPQLFTNTSPGECLLGRSRQEPSAEHWFGTDVQGCDYYTRVIYGARTSIAVGLLVALGTVVISIVLGTLAGFYGKVVDAVISRIGDMIFAVPYVLGAIVFLNVIDDRGILEVSFILTIFMWPMTMRLMRGAVMSVVNNEYVMAARALGAGNLTIMRRHILPNSLAPILGYSAILVGIIISAEAALTYLGVGLQLPSISWGLQLSNAQNYIQTYPHLMVFPLIFVALTVFAFTIMGDAIRDAIDPKAKK
ncbi:MAG: ABC transporter permease [Nesterenkonia sp.]|uniref:ABC transporter permease n=1 Tax=Nesterenkonia marinintestina TaxID=2979865 RepID=UPI0021BECBA6|nr:ABC transporter permease [Nesterenkonia sp. GX14115]MDO5493122.1 ABC transporter permease [Nesterenkonia sp.]